nr:hypothetical protein [Tanacetum cinerariifolium]
MGLPCTIPDEGTSKTKPLPEGPHGDKDSEGLKPPADMEPSTTLVFDPSGTNAKYQLVDMGLPCTIPDEGTSKTKPLPEGPHEDKDSEGLKPPADMEPSTTLVFDPAGTNAKYQVDQN